MPIALLLALAGSLGLHAAALFLPEMELSSLPEQVPLRAELQLPPKLADPPPAVVKPTPAAEKPLPSSPRKPRPESAHPVLTQPQPAEVSGPSAPAGSAARRGEEPASVPSPPAKPLLPAHGVIRFLVYRGNQGLQVGRAEHRWQFGEDGGYRISTVTETSGLAAFFKPVRMELESTGKLTVRGLQPERFSTRKNGAETNENADFDWVARQVKIHREAAPRPVVEGTQDLVSFQYQLAYLGALSEGVTLGVVSGKKYERYAFDNLGEETVDTPLGPFRTLHLRVQTDNTTELWLAVEHGLLPIKIRFTDRKGDSFEQIAADIGADIGTGPLPP